MCKYIKLGVESRILPKGWVGIALALVPLAPLAVLLFAYNWIHDTIPYISIFLITLILVFGMIIMTRIAQVLHYSNLDKDKAIEGLQSKEFGLAYSIFWDINRNPHCPFCTHKPPIRAKHRRGKEYLYCHSCDKPVYGKTWSINNNMGYKELKEKIDKVDFSTFPNLKDI